MPRINKGDPWEIKFRRDVRSITRGLTASGNGRGTIKSTQLVWRRDKEYSQSVSGAKNAKSIDYACMRELPWQKKSARRNLEIIKNSIEELKENRNLNFKNIIHKNAIEYDLKHPENGSKAIVADAYRGITKEHSDESETYYDEFLIEELPTSHPFCSQMHSSCIHLGPVGPVVKGAGPRCKWPGVNMFNPKGCHGVHKE